MEMADTLQHPFHEHELSLREVSQNSGTCCSFCKLYFHGPSYCCLDCDIFLHKSCALVELPPQIQHPSHPEHPLSLDSTSCVYHCWEEDCDFGLNASVAFATNVPPEDEAEEEACDRTRLRHLAHKHPLTPFYPRIDNLISCRACRGRIVSGRVYGCTRCRFFLDEACAQLPRRLQHPFHRKHALTLVSDWNGDAHGYCSVCKGGYEAPNLMYCCDECDIDHCSRCVISTLPPEGREMEEGAAAIECFFHEHRLTPCVVKMSPNIQCRVCRLDISGEVYCCFDCVFFVHKACLELEELTPEMNHYLHQAHPLVPRESEGAWSYCSCCSKSSAGMTFSCESCNFNLDVQCGLRTLSAVKAGAPAEIQYNFHPHPLTLLIYTIDKTSVGDKTQCAACKEPSDGLVYGCSTCKTFNLHKSCAEVELEVKHEFHLAHPLHLLRRAPFEYFCCSACHRESDGFSLSCSKCDFHLDLKCATTKRPTFKHARHEHDLAYFRRYMLNVLQCNSCGKSCNRDLYRCVPCNFTLHHDCLPLSPTLQHDCHPYHPLILFDKFIDGRPDAQYCDYCEEIRHPDNGVYRCPEEMCWYTVHIECVIPSFQARKPEVPDPSENPVLDKLEEDIADLEAKIEKMQIDLKAMKQRREALSGKGG